MSLSFPGNSNNNTMMMLLFFLSLLKLPTFVICEIQTFDLLLLPPGQKSHLRKTANKLKPSEDTINFFKSSPIWEVEEEFYNFVLDNFHMQKKRSLKTVDGVVMPISGQFLYEKIRPK